MKDMHTRHLANNTVRIQGARLLQLDLDLSIKGPISIDVGRGTINSNG